MAKKIRKTGTRDRGELTRLFLTSSLVSLPGIVAILAALWGVIPFTYAIMILIVCGAVGWVFMLRTMSRMGILRSLGRNTAK